jgi:hypothetical protein
MTSSLKRQYKNDTQSNNQNMTKNTNNSETNQRVTRAMMAPKSLFPLPLPKNRHYRPAYIQQAPPPYRPANQHPRLELSGSRLRHTPPITTTLALRCRARPPQMRTPITHPKPPPHISPTLPTPPNKRLLQSHRCPYTRNTRKQLIPSLCDHVLPPKHPAQGSLSPGASPEIQ